VLASLMYNKIFSFVDNFVSFFFDTVVVLLVLVLVLVIFFVFVN
jgi:hypothetical protein